MKQLKASEYHLEKNHERHSLSGSAMMACAMKRIEAPIKSTMSLQLLHIPVTWELKRDNATMKRIEARIESTMSVQLFHIPVTWEDSGTQVASIRF